MSEVARPLAWMRRWAYDGETPKKERQENGRMAWPLRYKLLPVTVHKVCATDVPLVADDHMSEEAMRKAAGLSFADALSLARGCTDYRGGHYGDAYEAFQHGIQTVVNVLVAAQKNGLSDRQIAVVHAIGSEVQP